LKPDDQIIKFAKFGYRLCATALETHGYIENTFLIQAGIDGGEGEDAFERGDYTMMSIDDSTDEAKDYCMQVVREKVREVKAQLVLHFFEVWFRSWPSDKPLVSELYERIKDQLPRTEGASISVYTPDGGWYIKAEITRDEENRPSLPEEMPELNYQDLDLESRNRFYPFE
jgi:hypothetical protein